MSRTEDLWSHGHHIPVMKLVRYQPLHGELKCGDRMRSDWVGKTEPTIVEQKR